MRWVTASSTGCSFMDEAVTEVMPIVPRAFALVAWRRLRTGYRQPGRRVPLELPRERSAEAPSRSGAHAGEGLVRMGRAGGPLGVRLRLADLAAGLRVCGTPAGAGARLASRAEDVEPHQPRHAGAAGAGVRLAHRRLLPRRRVPHPARAWRRDAGALVGARDGDGGLRPALAARADARGPGARAGFHPLPPQPEPHGRVDRGGVPRH